MYKKVIEVVIVEVAGQADGGQDKLSLHIFP